MSIKEFGKAITKEVKDDLKDYFKERDYMVITVAEKEPVRVYALKATNTVRQAQLIHGLSPILATVTGRVLCGALLLSSMIKHATDQKLVLKLETEGPIKSIVAEVDGFGNARCMVNTQSVENKVKEVDGKKKWDVKGIVGQGRLVVIKDIGLKEPYIGVVPLISGEIAEDIAYYLWKSEQIPSAVALGVLIGEDGTVREAGGYLVQPLGGASPKVVDEIEKRVRSLPPVSQMLDEGMRPEDIACAILESMNPHLIGLKEVKYFCPCSERIVQDVVKGMDPKELDKIFEINEVLEISCNYCGKVYRFTKEKVEALKVNEEPPSQDSP
ncbi:Hsp33 family molecular chaperone HslO [Thermosulfidibacter takaii]|nr:Hsp33 family molecular chaperone HslO [Thermosulfidibacter takaii]